MKRLAIILSILFAVTSFAANTQKPELVNQRMVCVLNNASHNFEVDYGLIYASQKQRRLSEALIFEGYLHTQIRSENEKYDRLALERTNGSRKKSTRGIKGQISRQYDITMDLVSQAESLSAYIDWLRM